MTKKASFTEGPIYGPLIRFAFPILAALFLQSLYGAVDLLVVGQFSSAAEVSAVSTGSQIMTTVTNLMAASSSLQIILCVVYLRRTYGRNLH